MKKKAIALMLALILVLCTGCAVSGGKNSGKTVTLQNRTSEPAAAATAEPTPVPTEIPTPVPTEVPTPVPTEVPTPVPTEVPTPVPTEEPATALDEAVVRRVLDTMGPDLIARAKDGDSG